MAANLAPSVVVTTKYNEGAQTDDEYLNMMGYINQVGQDQSSELR